MNSDSLPPASQALDSAPTIPDPSASLSAAEAVAEARPRLLVTQSPPTESDAEFRSMFRRRLLVLSMLYGSLVLYLFIFPDLLNIEVGPYHITGTPGMVMGAITTIVLGGAAVWLLRWRCPPPLGTLRKIELLLHGCGILFLAAWQYEEFSQLSIHPLWNNEYKHFIYKEMLAKASAYANSTHWFVFIIIYGLLVPNTWQRCITVCLATSAVPLLVHWAAFSSALAITYKLIIGSAMGCALATGLVVFGSYKIGTLQHEVKIVRQQVRALGQYQLKRRLGGGSMGEVYLAEHALLKRPCAVKFIRPELTPHSSYLARFQREVQAMACLTHPNVIEIYDYGCSEDGIFYYAMEYLAGLDLQQLIARAGSLPPGRAVYLLRQMCAGLREAHAKGLIHRDIKPGNILVAERGGSADFVKLLDFGLVRGLEEAEDGRLTQTGLVLGTPGYMSPQQAAGETALDARTDIYSIGAVAHFLLTGQAPFADKTPWKRIAAQVLESPRPLRELRADIPDDLAQVVARCLDRDAEQRFGDAGQLEQALAACVCAADWSAEQAADWWRSRPADESLADPGAVSSQSRSSEANERRP